MYLKSIELSGFKSFGKKAELVFGSPIAAIVGPNGSGKCVTGDTLLRRMGESGYENVRIADVCPGDSVASYDEASGAVTPGKVRALVPQGTRRAFRLTTESGRRIRATGNHPFLARDGWRELKDLREGTDIAVAPARGPRVALFVDDANLFYAQRNAGWKVSIAKLMRQVRALDCTLARYYAAVPDASDPARAGAETYLSRIRRHIEVREKPLKYLDGGKKGNVDVELAVDAIEHADEYDVAIIVSGDSDLVALRDHLLRRDKEVLFLGFRRSLAHELKSGKYLCFEDMRDAVELGAKKTTPEVALGRTSPVCLSYAASGGSSSEGAGGVWMERVAEIVPAGERMTFDVEIEGTHTFVGNGIVAHNSNVAEAFRFVLGEQSMKSLRSRKGEDLIWGGSPALARANRAGVKVVFDNASGRDGKRLLDIDFSEVIVERVVYRDGQNEYLLNGSAVRLKDIVRLLAGANIGGSGYQIISQGEADRILNASPRERREMVEDALGLKLFQHKKAESERKLAETATNIEKTRSLRREIAPHLHFLRQQVEKIEKAREMKEELSARLSEYLARENAFITQQSAYVKEEEQALRAELKERGLRITDARRKLTAESDRSGERRAGDEQAEKLEARRASARAAREELARELGRAEAALEFAAPQKERRERSVSAKEARSLAERVEQIVAEGERMESVEAVRGVFVRLRKEIESFIASLASGSGGEQATEGRAAEAKVKEIAERLARAVQEEEEAEAAIRSAREEAEKGREALHAAERVLLVEEGAERECRAKLETVHEKIEEYAILRRRFEDEVREGIALIGAGVHAWEASDIPPGALAEPRSEQEKRRRAIERLKIKIEESGASRGDEVMREFKQTKERDEFLARELADLESSGEKLKDIIAELEKTIDVRFAEGVTKINDALGGFFAKLFGGGGAKLVVEKSRRKALRASDGTGPDDSEEDLDDIGEEDELYTGLSITVSLPRKKVRGLEVLSGGERALTSIALIFAMSQVHPPPFLILDETDAALDEANSRRYADMVRELGKKSQLIVITHNRATMAAAGELYGVTMDASGVSKLLSVKLQEAEKVAK